MGLNEASAGARSEESRVGAHARARERTIFFRDLELTSLSGQFGLGAAGF